MEELNGIVLYDIEFDGCLNGVYTNDRADGEIFNEIAKLQLGQNRNEIIGNYDCFYFSVDPPRNNMILNIAPAAGIVGGFTFTWRTENGQRRFTGTGYRMNQRQLVVHYRNAE